MIGALFDEAIVGFVADLIRGIESLPTWLVTGLVLFGQVLGVVVILGGAVMAVVRRRWLLLGITAAAAGVAVLLTLLIRPIVDHFEPQVADVDASYTLVPADRVASAVGLAILAAIVTAAAPWISVGGVERGGPW